MKQAKKLLVLFLSIILAIFPLSGCSSGTANIESSTANGTSTSSAAPAGSKDDQASLRFMWWGGDSRHKATLAAIDAYTAKNPNVKIEAEYGAFDGYLDKVMVQTASGSLADIVQMDQPWMGSIINKNSKVFLNINDYGGNIDLSVYDADFLKQYCVYSNVLVGVPFSVNVGKFMLNDTLLKEAGIQVADQLTWKSLIEYGNQLRAYNKNCSLFSIAWSDYALLLRMYIAQKTGGDFMKEDFTPNFDGELLKDTFEYFKALFDSGATQDVEVLALYGGNPYVDPDRLNGNLAISFCGPNDWDYVLSTFPKGISASYTSFPKLEDKLENTGFIFRPGQMCSISATTKNPEAACAFVDAMGKDDEIIKTLGVSRGVPGSSHAVDALKNAGILTDFLVNMLESAKKDAGKPYCWVSTDSEIQNVTIEMIQNVAFDEMTPAEAAEEAMRLYKNRLAEIKKESNG